VFSRSKEELMGWAFYISIGAAIGLWVVIHGWNPADHPPAKVTQKSLVGVVLGALGGAVGALATGGAALSDPMPARAAVAALAVGYIFSGIGTFLGTGGPASTR